MPAQLCPLLFVDGHNLLWRAAFGFPAVISSRDKTRDLTAEFGFFALLRVAVRDELPTPPEILVVFDGQHGTEQRKAADPAYKSGRVLDDGALRPLRAIPRVQEALDLLGIAYIEIDTVEADDVIATLVAQSAETEPDRETWIMSSDRDYHQLLTDRIVALNTALRRGHRRIDAADVHERYGVTPDQWPCYRALTGDPADDIPGVPGIGAHTAARLLAGGARLEDLPDTSLLGSRRHRTLLEHWDDVLRWRELIRLRTDVVLPRTPTGHPSRALPAPAEVIDKLGLW
ncbi:DNA polymerase-1 [Actinoalloteichus hoggarensis]|uniref:5'-3' exonuclease n=1 Tax=Actinoalloteichus hoggarensis TaxID=1470176 RepID=A0A221W6P4_9PSEU|nr:5'-3' exonuclease H3TH domain-containing protein [Actinoalloteichus hoggarensis]ASO21568.1 DNA polymerase I, thermostable [Actinoalloteichus hoggarensis]MBB5922160.1 DNA polymerase-1 [Actinoalloteichus hoggarensis]